MRRGAGALLLWSAFQAGVSASHGGPFCEGPVIAAFTWQAAGCSASVQSLLDAENACKGSATCSVIVNVNCDSALTWRTCDGQSLSAIQAASATLGDQMGCSRISCDLLTSGGTTPAAVTTTAAPTAASTPAPTAAPAAAPTAAPATTTAGAVATTVAAATTMGAATTEGAVATTTAAPKTAQTADAYLATVIPPTPVVTGATKITVAQQVDQFTTGNDTKSAIAAALASVFGIDDVSQVSVASRTSTGAAGGRLRRLQAGGTTTVEFALTIPDGLVSGITSLFPGAASALVPALNSQLDRMGLGGIYGSLQVDSVTPDATFVYISLYEGDRQTCGAAWQKERQHGITNPMQCRELCDVDAECKFYFLNVQTTCFTYTQCTTTRIPDGGGTTFQKVPLRSLEASDWVVAGPCTASGDCITSPDYPLGYPSLGSCTMEPPAGYAVNMNLSTERYFDFVTINGDRFSGSQGVSYVEPTAALTWSSDYSIEGAGWTICLTPATTTTPAPTPAPPTETTITITMTTNTTTMTTQEVEFFLPAGDESTDILSSAEFIAALCALAALCVLCTLLSLLRWWCKRRQRKKPQTVPPPVKRSRDRAPKFKVGDHVEGKYTNEKWYPCLVRQIHKKRNLKGVQYSYTIDWDDQDLRERVKEEELLRYIVEEGVPSEKPSWLKWAEDLWASHVAAWHAKAGTEMHKSRDGEECAESLGLAMDETAKPSDPNPIWWPPPERLDADRARGPLDSLRELRWSVQDKLWPRALRSYQGTLDNPKDVAARTLDMSAKDDREFLLAANGAPLSLFQLTGYQNMSGADKLHLPSFPDGRCSRMFKILLQEANDSWRKHAGLPPEEEELAADEPPEIGDAVVPAPEPEEPEGPLPDPLDSDLVRVITILGYTGHWVDRFEFEFTTGQRRVYESGPCRDMETTFVLSDYEYLNAVEQIVSQDGFWAGFIFITSAGNKYELYGSAGNGSAGQNVLVEAPEGYMIVGLKFDQHRILIGIATAPVRAEVGDENYGVRMAHKPRVTRQPFSVCSSVSNADKQVPPLTEAMPLSSYEESNLALEAGDDQDSAFATAESLAGRWMYWAGKKDHVPPIALPYTLTKVEGPVEQYLFAENHEDGMRVLGTLVKDGEWALGRLNKGEKPLGLMRVRREGLNQLLANFKMLGADAWGADFICTRGDDQQPGVTPLGSKFSTPRGDRGDESKRTSQLHTKEEWRRRKGNKVARLEDGMEDLWSLSELRSKNSVPRLDTTPTGTPMTTPRGLTNGNGNGNDYAGGHTHQNNGALPVVSPRVLAGHMSSTSISTTPMTTPATTPRGVQVTPRATSRGSQVTPRATSRGSRGNDALQNGDAQFAPGERWLNVSRPDDDVLLSARSKGAA